MKTHVLGIAALALIASTGITSADEGSFKGRTNAVGANCRGSTYFDIEVTIAGDKAEGTIQGSAFQRGPVKFSGSAAGNGFTATYVFQNLNNLQVVISGTRVDADNYALKTVWAAGGPSNCESTGVGKKA